MTVKAYFSSPQFAWSAVIFLIGVGLAVLGAAAAYFTDEISGRGFAAAGISALIVGATRLGEGINDAARAATGDVKPRDVQPLPLVPPPPMN